MKWLRYIELIAVALVLCTIGKVCSQIGSLDPLTAGEEYFVRWDSETK